MSKPRKVLLVLFFLMISVNLPAPSVVPAQEEDDSPATRSPFEDIDEATKKKLIEESQKAVPSSNIVKYFRAEGGIPFPPEDEAEESLRRGRESASKENTADKFETLVKQAPVLTKQESPALGICERSGTLKEDLGTGVRELDLLFVPAALTEAQAADIGTAVQVHEYKPGSTDAFSLIAARAGASCLPFRMRVARGVGYKHLGKDALRNFEVQPGTKGKE